MPSIVQLREQLTHLVWRDRLASIPAPRRWLVQAARTLYVVVRDIAEGQLTLRAMSLVYTTLLSLVPLLAVSFSVLKGFGVESRIESLMLNVLEPMGEKGIEITEKVIGFVGNVKAGVLGGVGLILLFYTVVSLLQKIERAFNYTWRVSDARSFAQRFSDYLSVVVIGPVLVFTAVGLTASAMSNSVVDALRALPVMGMLFDAVGRLVPYMLIVAAFTMIYIFVPNTRVRLKSALIGGIVAGILWQSTGWAFAAFIVNSAKYTAIYSAFASLVLFMIWLYLGWLILLIGASIAFYHQNPHHLRHSREVLRLSNREREALALQVGLLVGRAFHEGRPPLNEAELAHRLAATEDAVGIITHALCQQGLLHETHSPAGLAPTRSLENITLIELYNAVRGESIATERTAMVADSSVAAVTREVEQAIAGSLGERTLRDLVLEEIESSGRKPLAAANE
ncbi:MAG: YihY/virulence factor BrkB family protein [Proteobacteria bacterium]|nr:MAG: YihY/virulence factor BrkB family protein [Pseudomonadota bacterium]QKK11624.1 MAG: YihY/virulence factor BrkB family protein [Pseudomonadota bacterium]